MRIQLLIATDDCDYAEHLSCILAEDHADIMDVNVCGTTEHFNKQISSKQYDIALLDTSILYEADLQSIRLPLLLWSDNEYNKQISADIKKIRKYQRISNLVSSMLELYSKGLTNIRSPESKRARITAFWSPMGGVGKTTAALAFSAGSAARGKDAFYLNLEQFSSVSAYFNDSGRSISTAFEMLESEEGSIKMLIRSIRQQDKDSGISYLCRPDNFDDMNILSPENWSTLIDACSEMTDELAIDLSSVCDERVQKVFDLADRVLIVTDLSNAAQTKLSQFATQHDIFQRIKDKICLVANKGVVVRESVVDTIISLPLVHSTDATVVFKTLASISFDQ